MAYLKPVKPSPCGCGKPATYEVFNQVNRLQGVFCAVCARKKTKELTARERSQAGVREALLRSSKV